MRVNCVYKTLSKEFSAFSKTCIRQFKSIGLFHSEPGILSKWTSTQRETCLRCNSFLESNYPAVSNIWTLLLEQKPSFLYYKVLLVSVPVSYTTFMLPARYDKYQCRFTHSAWINSKNAIINYQASMYLLSLVFSAS